MSNTTEREAWRTAFDERHEFDVYPDHFMTGLRNEFCAGWHAALKANAASDCVLVDRGALQAVINMLRRDAEEGRTVRGEMADELMRKTP